MSVTICKPGLRSTDCITMQQMDLRIAEAWMWCANGVRKGRGQVRHPLHGWKLVVVIGQRLRHYGADNAD